LVNIPLASEAAIKFITDMTPAACSSHLSLHRHTV